VSDHRDALLMPAVAALAEDRQDLASRVSALEDRVALLTQAVAELVTGHDDDDGEV
jgi:hypothetical protein